MSEHNGKVCVRAETENLILKPIDMSDKEFVFRQFSNSDVTRYLLDEEPITKIEEAERMINSYTVPEPRKRHRWIIIRKSDAAPIGTCGYHNWDTKNNICEIGYDLYPDFWGNGYMTEALRKVITIGFNKMNLNKIYALVYVENNRSVDLLLRLGFKQEGILRDQFLFRGEYYDHFSFSLLKREWNNAISY